MMIILFILVLKNLIYNMNIKKFEGFDSGEYDYEYGGHCFVFAKPKKKWSDLNINSFKDDEYAPCMVSGYGTQSLSIIGSQYSYNIKDFDIIKDSEFKTDDIRKIINLYKSTKKFNL